MSQTRMGTGGSYDPASTRAREESPGGALMTDLVSMFAGVMLLISAAFGIIQGISAIANGDLYAAGSDYLYTFNMAFWGWTHLVIGVLCLAVAVGILVGASWGQVVGMIIAGISALANFAFLPHYPLWAITIIAVDVLVIRALAVQLERE